MSPQPISRRQFLSHSGLATAGTALGGLVSLGVDPERIRTATVVCDSCRGYVKSVALLDPPRADWGSGRC